MNHCISWFADIFFFPSLWRSRAVSSSEWTKTICCRFPAVTSRSVFITRSCFLWFSFATWQSWTGAVVSQTAVSDSTCMFLHAWYCFSWGLEIIYFFSKDFKSESLEYFEWEFLYYFKFTETSLIMWLHVRCVSIPSFGALFWSKSLEAKATLEQSPIFLLTIWRWQACSYGSKVTKLISQLNSSGLKSCLF